MPTGQGQADANYQQLVGNATPWAQQLPGQVIPGLSQVVSNVQSNPYYAGAQQGANYVSDTAMNNVAPAMFEAANTMRGVGDNYLSSVDRYVNPVASASQAAFNRGQVLSDRAADQITPMMQGGMNNAANAWKTAYNAIPGLTGGMNEANTLLANGFDPQGALYDRSYQQMQDQQNAINSMYGLGSSAYGAGVAGDAARNFNIDWQNNQLGRQLAALQGYGQHTGQVTSNLTNLLGSGSNNYNMLMNGAADRGLGFMNASSNLMNQGVDNLRQGYATAANIYDTFNRGAADMYGAASSHGADALNTLTTATMLPNQVYLGNQDSQVAALQALAQGAGASLSPTGQLIDASGNYLNIGQNATQLAQNAAQINAQAKAAGWSALAQGLGSIAGMALAPMTGGMSLFGSMAGAGMGGGMGAIVSDRRAKTDIKRIGRLDNGLPVYLYRYRKGDGRRRIGVMAQDVRKVRPDAVVRRRDGLLAVDYGALAA